MIATTENIAGYEVTEVIQRMDPLIACITILDQGTGNTFANPNANLVPDDFPIFVHTSFNGTALHDVSCQ
ncbi:hypothetical protein QFZ77_002049 [Paenibacillus sp. V4I3]|nr:hypothetical protein [Paenibacillus sp. V4I3]